MSMNVEKAYRLAAERYQEIGVDTEAAMARLNRIPISLHCWQGDDVRGFEQSGGELGGGLAATGNYPGAARTADELRADAARALSLIPGRHRFNLHACYGEFGGRTVDRDEIRPEHFAGWIDWAKSLGIGLDFNPTYFSHRNAADNATLSHADEGIRSFWVRHGIASRKIGEAMGRALGNPCVTNFWIPDGMKDTPVDRTGPRARLVEALDGVFAEPIDRLRAAERDGDYTGRLAFLEEAKTLPFGAVWDRYCGRSGVPVGDAWLSEVRRYERDVLSARR